MVHVLSYVTVSNLNFIVEIIKAYLLNGCNLMRTKGHAIVIIRKEIKYKQAYDQKRMEINANKVVNNEIIVIIGSEYL